MCRSWIAWRRSERPLPLCAGSPPSLIFSVPDTALDGDTVTECATPDTLQREFPDGARAMPAQSLRASRPGKTRDTLGPYGGLLYPASLNAFPESSRSRLAGRECATGLAG